MPQAVVLPEPCRPAIRITVGGRFANERPEPALPISSVSSSCTIFTTCWPGVRLSHHLGAHRPLAHLGHEVAHDAEVDVGLEQREPDLAHRLLDVLLAQPALAAQAVERGAEAIGEGFEHREA